MLESSFSHQVLVRCLSLEELLALPDQAFSGETNADLATVRMEAWQRSINKFGKAFFEQITTNYGSLRDIQRKLGKQPDCDLTHLIWYEDCQKLIEHLRQDGAVVGSSTSLKLDGIPFCDVFAKIASFAQSKINSEYPDPDGQLNHKKIQDCTVSYLYECLSEKLSLPIYQEFVRFRNAKEADSDVFNYVEFSDYMTEIGWESIFSSRPVIIRVMHNILEQWCNLITRFLSRLSCDWTELCDCFLLGDQNSAKLVEIEFGLSDPHCKGQSVAKLSFDCGRVLLYKPRDLQIDVAWTKFVHWLSNEGFPNSLRVPHVLNCNGYGWVEFIAEADCASIDDVATYFRTAGCWATLFHMFNTRDVHEENVIADGSQIVPVDFEASLTAIESKHLFGSIEMEAVNRAWDRLEGTVNATGIIPTVQALDGNRVKQIGALQGGSYTELKQVIWQNIDQTTIFPDLVPLVAKTASGLPKFKGKIVDLYDEKEAFLAGMRSTFGFLLSKPFEFSKNTELYKEFERASVRRILRPTAFYALMLGRLNDPRQLADGVTWSVQLKFLDRLPGVSASGKLNAFLRAAEDRALLQGDVPWFAHDSKATVINDGVRECATEGALISGLELVDRRFASNDQLEVSWQLELAELAVNAAQLESGKEIRNPSRRTTGTRDFSEDEALKILVDESHRIFRSIALHAETSEHSASWIGITSQSGHRGGSVGQLGHSLYGGQGGISCFLACYSAQYDCNDARHLAYKAIAPVRSLLSGSNLKYLESGMGAGGLAGVAGVIYSLSFVGDFLGNDHLIEEALAAAKSLSRTLLETDISFDLVSGQAGTILALSKLYNLSRNCLGSR
jgi:type 2 lantibiotic biosynthesis protein LanM